MRPSESRLIDLPKIDDVRGSLSYVQTGIGIPFRIERVFFIYGVPAGAKRAGHALKTCDQLIVAVSGMLDVTIDDGEAKLRRSLNSAERGLYVPAMNWLELGNFTRGAVCLVLASEPYAESGYIRNYEEFRAAAEVF